MKPSIDLIISSNIYRFENWLDRLLNKILPFKGKISEEQSLEVINTSTLIKKDTTLNVCHLHEIDAFVVNLEDEFVPAFSVSTVPVLGIKLTQLSEDRLDIKIFCLHDNFLSFYTDILLGLQKEWPRTRDFVDNQIKQLPPRDLLIPSSPPETKSNSFIEEEGKTNEVEPVELKQEEKIKYSITHKGEFWELVFEEEKGLFKNVDGMHYLQTLLTHPYEKYSPIELYKIVHGDPERYIEIPDTECRLDKRAMDEIHQKIEKLNDEIEEIEAFGGDTYDQKLELQQIYDYLSEHTFMGRSKPLENKEYERRRGAVKNGIRKVKEKIKVQMPDFYSHLNKYLQATSYYPPIYSPEWNKKTK